MDDLDHSVYIAEQDWDSFFEESEECNLQQGALAGLDESSLSDFDEAEFCLSNQEVRASQELGPLRSHNSIDSTSDFEELHVEPYESTESLHGPEDVLSAGVSDKHLETVTVFFERTVTSGDDEDLVELGCTGQMREALSKDSRPLTPPETAEPASACCAAHEGDIYQETARDCEDTIGNTSKEPEIQTNATLSTESVTDEEEGAHCISNFSEVKFARCSLQASNERGHYSDPAEGEAYSVLKGSHEGRKMETEEPEAERSSLTRASASFLDPRKDSQMNTEVQPDANIPARAEHLNDHEKPPKKEKERWFVTVNVGQTHSREKTCPPAKKKRRKKSRTEDVPKLGSGSEGQDPDFQGNSGAERLGVFEPQIQEIDSNPDQHPPDCIPAAEGLCSSEFAEPTIIEHHKLKNDDGVLMLSRELLPVFQTTCEFDEYKVNCQESQQLDNHQEQHKVSFGSNLQMTVALEGKLALNCESSQPNCTEMSSWTEPSKPTAVITPNPPNHQNLLVKLLFSTQSDTGCEILAFCKDSDQENLPLYPEERASQEYAEAKNQSKNCLPLSQTNGTSTKCPEDSIFFSESSIPIESPESSNYNVVDTIPGSHSLHKCLSADQQVALESKTFLSEVPQITEVPKPSGLLMSEINNGSDELDQSKNKVQNSPKIQKDHTCPDQQKVKKSNNELINSKKTSMVCVYGAEKGDAPVKCVTPEKDSTLSASDNTQCTQPLTVTKVNSCLPTADQQSIAKRPYLEPFTSHPVDATVSNESSDDFSPNESSIMMFMGSGSHNPKRNKDNHTGDLCLSSANMSQADYAENLTTQTFPEFQQPPFGPMEGEELNIEETLAEEAPTAGLSAVDSLDCNSKSTVEDELVLPKEPVTCTRGLESRELDGALDSTRPVYAISSFWDEMEKLTINDILHLRLVCNAQYPREFSHQQDGAATDVSDAADSGFFAHPDDSKPDRSTGDGSPFSDFEEEFLETLSAGVNPSPEPQDAKSQVLWSPDPGREWWESAPAPTCMGSENDAGQGMALPSEDTISQHLFTDSTQSHKTMCKTVTVQNLQTLEEDSQSSMLLPVTVREEDENSMLFSLQPRPEETCSLTPMEHGNDIKSSSLPFLSRKTSPENSVMSLSEISEHLFGKDEAETSLTDRSSPIVLSLPETTMSDRSSPIVLSLPETTMSDISSPIVLTLPEMTMSDRSSPIVLSLPEMTMSDRSSPIVLSLPEMTMSDRSSPIVLTLPETTMSDRSSPIVLTLPETTTSDRSSPIISLCDRAPNNLSLPETYDYFFSDFETGNFFFPSIQRLSNHTNRGVPIFSCSVKRELWFTKSEDDAPVHMATRFDNQANEPLDTMVGPDTYEHFFTDKDWRGNLFWRNPLSMRRLRFTGGLYSSRDKSTSWAFAATGWRESCSSLFRTIDPGNTIDDQGTSHSHPNLYIESQLCSEFRQQRDTDLQAVVSFPKKGFLFMLKQSDICLVCIAFASWVLKSANPQSEDTWKTVLLANVSAISAIQYLRRYIREDTSGNRR